MQYAKLYVVLFSKAIHSSCQSGFDQISKQTPTRGSTPLNSCHESLVEAITAVIGKKIQIRKEDSGVKSCIRPNCGGVFNLRCTQISGSWSKVGSLIKMAGYRRNKTYF